MKRNNLEKREDPPSKRLAIDIKPEGPLTMVAPEMLEHILTVDHVLAAGDLAFNVSLVCKRMADACDVILCKRYEQEIYEPLHAALETRQIRVDPVWGDRTYYGCVVLAYITMMKTYRLLEPIANLQHINGRQRWARFTLFFGDSLGFRTAIAYNCSVLAMADPDEDGPVGFAFNFKEAHADRTVILPHEPKDELFLRSDEKWTEAVQYNLWSPMEGESFDSLHPSVIQALVKHDEDLEGWWSRLLAVHARDGWERYDSEDGGTRTGFGLEEERAFGDNAINIESKLWHTILWYYPHTWACCSPTEAAGGHTWIAGLLHGRVGDIGEYYNELPISDYVLDHYESYIKVDSETRLATLRLRLFFNNDVEFKIPDIEEEDDEKEDMFEYDDDWEPPSDQQDTFLPE